MRLKAWIPLRATLTWGVLIALSLLGPSLGTGRHSTTITLLVLAIGVVKVRLVGLDFMELRQAPGWMRWALEGYCVALLITLWALYLAP